MTTESDRSPEPGAGKATGLEGLLVVDKPGGLTSHDVVARIRRISRTKRVGHTGTLDPMATGVLVVCLGRATRLIPYLEEGSGPAAKEYEAEIRFGFETTTDDAEGEPLPGVPGAIPNETQVRDALASFVGRLQQVPPGFSAKKVAGERAYALARRGETPDLKASEVHVASATLLRMSGDRAVVTLACSRGTYVRALARDLGRAIGSAAHLTRLRRTRAGDATLDQATPLDELTYDEIAGRLIGLADILGNWPRATVSGASASDLRLGRAVGVGGAESGRESASRVRVVDPSGGLVALARVAEGRFQPFCVFP